MELAFLAGSEFRIDMCNEGVNSALYLSVHIYMGPSDADQDAQEVQEGIILLQIFKIIGGCAPFFNITPYIFYHHTLGGVLAERPFPGELVIRDPLQIKGVYLRNMAF